jgi:hypothetical protein
VFDFVRQKKGYMKILIILILSILMILPHPIEAAEESSHSGTWFIVGGVIIIGGLTAYYFYKKHQREKKAEEDKQVKQKMKDKQKQQEEREAAELRKWLRAGIPEQDIRPWKKEGFTLDETLEWRSCGITAPVEASEWVKDGFTTGPEAMPWRNKGIDNKAAVKWKQLGFISAEAKEWSKVFPNPGFGITGWKDAGFMPDEVEPWQKASWGYGSNSLSYRFSANEATYWKKSALGPSLSAFYINLAFDPEEAVELNNRLMKICKNKIGTLAELNSCHPNQVKGKYFRFMGKNIRLLSKTAGLYKSVQLDENDNDQKIYKINFGKKSAPPNMVIVLVKGIGVYKYTTDTGAAETIPVLSVVYLFNKK